MSISVSAARGALAWTSCSRSMSRSPWRRRTSRPTACAPRATWPRRSAYGWSVAAYHWSSSRARTLRYPATTDPKILGEVLDNSGKGAPKVEGSSLAAAFEQSLAAFPTDADPRRGRAIVIVSDGEITLGTVPDTAQLLNMRIGFYTIGVGTPSGGQVPTYSDKDGSFTGYLRGPDGRAV